MNGFTKTGVIQCLSQDRYDNIFKKKTSRSGGMDCTVCDIQYVGFG